MIIKKDATFTVIYITITIICNSTVSSDIYSNIFICTYIDNDAKMKYICESALEFYIEVSPD